VRSGDGTDIGLVAQNGSSLILIEPVTQDLQTEGVSGDKISTATIVGNLSMRRATAEALAQQCK
jgi:hypothetical protein